MQWWDKAEKEKEQSNRETVWIIFQRDHHKKAICIDEEFLKSMSFFKYINKTILNEIICDKYLQIFINNKQLLIIDFDYFLDQIKPWIKIRKIKRRKKKGEDK